jgi:dTDP-4-amino-4,6-dideoxygalactose transaminase
MKYLTSCAKLSEEHGVMTALHKTLPVHLQPAFKTALFENGSLRVTESVCREILSLPMYLGLAPEIQEQVCGLIEAFEEN